MNLKEEYEAGKEKWSRKLENLKTKIRLTGWGRLFVFLSGAILPFVFFESFSTGFFVTMVFFALVFVFLVKYAVKLGANKQFASRMLEVNIIELEVLDFKFRHLPAGNEFIAPEHDFSGDLDIFGKGSVFQYINRTSTKVGYEKLARKLANPLLTAGEIKKAQYVVRELAGKKAFRQQFYALGKMMKEDDKTVALLKNITKVDLSFYGTKEKILSVLFPLLSLLILILFMTGLLPVRVVVWLFFTGLIISGLYFRRITRIHKQISKLGSLLGSYSRLITLVEREVFESESLLILAGELTQADKKVSEIIKQLSRNINYLDQRMNMFTGPLLNGFFLWDLVVTGSLVKWFGKYKNSIKQWFDIVHELDAYNSLAGFAYNHPEFTFPEFSEDTPVSSKGLGHPLIPPAERVDNDFTLDKDAGIAIITGANMAGKSTFLRTVGVNMILAGSGTMVCADKFTYRPQRLITSMRTFDSLDKHESYFFSELKRLKYIVDELRRGEKIFFILDEILKGTNSHDKTKGSIALTEKLMELGAAGIIATHDLELGKLEEKHPGRIVNKCFEVEFDNGKLIFDYTLRNGITHSHNATYLMRNMGLI
ncbi:MAG: DNA mismatch repair protein MutS [Chlorobi bacterium]|nr:DNA mismatch repair protein MutS [Chlorobiota bacterium]